jgi:hypothetical protein
MVGPRISACCCLWFAGRYSATRCMTHAFRPTKRHVSSYNPVSTTLLRVSRLVSGLQNIHVVLASLDFGLGLVSQHAQSGVRPPCLKCMGPIRVLQQGNHPESGSGLYFNKLFTATPSSHALDLHLEMPPTHANRLSRPPM